MLVVQVLLELLLVLQLGLLWVQQLAKQSVAQ